MSGYLDKEEKKLILTSNVKDSRGTREAEQPNSRALIIETTFAPKADNFSNFPTTSTGAEQAYAVLHEPRTVQRASCFLATSQIFSSEKLSTQLCLRYGCKLVVLQIPVSR